VAVSGVALNVTVQVPPTGKLGIVALSVLLPGPVADRPVVLGSVKLAGSGHTVPTPEATTVGELS